MGIFPIFAPALTVEAGRGATAVAPGETIQEATIGTTNLGAPRCARIDSQTNTWASGVMTKSELIDRLAAQLPQLAPKDAGLAVGMILHAIAESLANGERIEIRGFGAFDLNYRRPRTAHNPKSGERVRVPEKHVPHFKAAKELRERVDLPYRSGGGDPAP